MQSFVPLPIDTSSHSIYCLMLARTSSLRCEGLIRPYLPLAWSLRKGHGKSYTQSPDILQWLLWFPMSENIGSFPQERLQDFAPSGTIVITRYFFFLICWYDGFYWLSIIKDIKRILLGCSVEISLVQRSVISSDKHDRQALVSDAKGMWVSSRFGLRPACGKVNGAEAGGSPF